MRRFHRPLVYYNVDRDDCSALTRAAEVAEAHDLPLSVVDVEPPPSWYASVLEGVDDAAVAQSRENRLELLTSRVERLGLGRLVDRVDVLMGVPAVEIIREVLRHDHDLVLKTAEGTLGVRAALFGTTAKRLLRKCPCPVWVVRPEDQPPRRVLVNINPDPSNPESIKLNRVAVGLAAGLAKLYEADLWVLHVWDVGIHRRAKNHIDPASYQRFRDAMHEEINAAMVSFLEQMEISPDRLRLEKGHPGLVIPAFAERNEVDVVVMNSLGPTSILGVVIGDVAEEVFERLNCTLLALKPPTFVSPIS